MQEFSTSAALGPNALRVEVLVEFRVFRHGRNVPLSETGQQLVAWLAVQGRPRSRTMTATTMWPDRSDSEAAGSLRRALWRLNREAPGLVVRDNHLLGLAHDTALDLGEVHRLAAAAQEGTVPGGDAAVRLLEGDLLPEWTFEWLDVPRESLRQLRLHLLETLARVNLDLGRPAAALTAALAAVGVEPLRESAHRTAIAVHLAEGNVAEALRHYRRYCELLWTELRLEPGRELADMLHDVLPASEAAPAVRLLSPRRSR